jgi:predicted nuclease of restriction endonuclease-like RecB superfamily
MTSKSKYGNVISFTDDGKFDSQLELNLYNFLVEKFGKESISRQVKVSLSEPNTYFPRGIVWTPDFILSLGDKKIVIEAKGIVTSTFRLQLNLFATKFPEIMKDRFLLVFGDEKLVSTARLTALRNESMLLGEVRVQKAISFSSLMKMFAGRRLKGWH